MYKKTEKTREQKGSSYRQNEGQIHKWGTLSLSKREKERANEELALELAHIDK